MSTSFQKNGATVGASNPPAVQINILGSSSSGNAVFCKIPVDSMEPVGVLFDAGLPFGKLKETLYKTDVLLITHDHSDHVSKQVLQKIAKFFPSIQMFSTYRVARLCDSVTAINLDFLPISLGRGLELFAVEVPHGGSLCYGYFLSWGPAEAKKWLLYSTDLCSTKPLEKFCLERGIRLDTCLLEANYDPERLKLFGDHFSGRYNPYVDSSSRHLSRDEHLIFRKKFLKEGGESYELHKSDRFY